jgi:hypothetical protein
MDYKTFVENQKRLRKEVVFDALQYIDDSVDVAKKRISEALKDGQTFIKLYDEILAFEPSEEKLEKWCKYHAKLDDYVECQVYSKISAWLQSLGYENSIHLHPRKESDDKVPTEDDEEDYIYIRVWDFGELVKEYEEAKVANATVVDKSDDSFVKVDGEDMVPNV